MNSKQEKAWVEAILAKKDAGLPLTKQEENVLAYSPFGYAGGCSSCAAPAKPYVNLILTLPLDN